jgi:hypothetical protein
MPLSGEDRAAIESLVFDPTLAPGFEIVKYCLIWSDERPVGISHAGYEYVSDLWVARGYIHRGVPTERWGLGPEPYLKTWNDALDTCLRWPGFRRLPLSIRDQKYLDEQLAKSPLEDY